MDSPPRRTVSRRSHELAAPLPNTIPEAAVASSGTLRLSSGLKPPGSFRPETTGSRTPFSQHLSSTDLVVTAEIPALNLNSTLRMQVRAQAMDNVAQALQNAFKDLMGHCGPQRAELVKDGEQFAAFKEAAGKQLAEWQSRLVEAEQAKTRAERAMQELSRMRQAYFKELSGLREQLFQKHRAESNGEEYKPHMVQHFRPSDHVVEEENSEICLLLRDQAEKFQDKIDDLLERNRRLRDMVLAKNLKIALNKKLVDAMIETRKTDAEMVDQEAPKSILEDLLLSMPMVEMEPAEVAMMAGADAQQVKLAAKEFAEAAVGPDEPMPFAVCGEAQTDAEMWTPQRMSSAEAPQTKRPVSEETSWARAYTSDGSDVAEYSSEAELRGDTIYSGVDSVMDDEEPRESRPLLGVTNQSSLVAGIVPEAVRRGFPLSTCSLATQGGLSSLPITPSGSFRGGQSFDGQPGERTSERFSGRTPKTGGKRTVEDILNSHGIRTDLGATESERLRDCRGQTPVSPGTRKGRLRPLGSGEPGDNGESVFSGEEKEGQGSVSPKEAATLRTKLGAAARQRELARLRGALADGAEDSACLPPIKGSCTALSRPESGNPSRVPSFNDMALDSSLIVKPLQEKLQQLLESETCPSERSVSVRPISHTLPSIHIMQLEDKDGAESDAGRSSLLSPRTPHERRGSRGSLSIPPAALKKEKETKQEVAAPRVNTRTLGLAEEASVTMRISSSAGVAVFREASQEPGASWASEGSSCPSPSPSGLKVVPPSSSPRQEKGTAATQSPRKRRERRLNGAIFVSN